MAHDAENKNVTLAYACATMVFVPLTITGTGVLLPSISADLHASLSWAQWVMNALMVTFGSVLAVTGSLADLVGRRRMFTWGGVLFCAATLVAAAAPTIPVLIAARAVSGIGAAALTTSSTALLSHTFADQSRARAFSIFGTVLGLGLAFAPLAAGVVVLADDGWRIFFAIIGLALVPLLWGSRNLPDFKDPHPAGPDWAGAALFISGLVLLVLGISEGPLAGWGHPIVIGSFAGFAALLAVFVRVERKKEYPLIDLTLFRNKGFLSVCVAPVLLGFGFISVLFYLPVYFVTVDSMTAFDAGLLLLLLTAPSLVLPPIVGRLRSLLSLRALLLISLAFLVLGPIWLALALHPHSSALALAGPLLLTGASFGTSLAFLDVAAVDAVPPSRAGMAAGVFNTMRLGGESIMIAVTGALLASFLQSALASQLGADAAHTAAASLLQGDSGTASSQAGGALLARQTAQAVFTGAWQNSLLVIAAVCFLGLVSIGLLTRKSVGRERSIASEQLSEVVYE